MYEAIRENRYLGPMTMLCPHCQALRFEGEALNCCHNDKVSLPSLSNYSSPLKEHLKVASMVMLLILQLSTVTVLASYGRKSFATEK